MECPTTGGPGSGQCAASVYAQAREQAPARARALARARLLARGGAKAPRAWLFRGPSRERVSEAVIPFVSVSATESYEPRQPGIDVV